jgi:pyrroline-5-carboxylate reductase
MKEYSDIAILGAGNLGIAIANGLRHSGFLNNRRLTLTRRKPSVIHHMASSDVIVTDSNTDAVSSSDIIILAVQPGQLHTLLGEIRPVLSSERHIIVSVITAISIADIATMLNGDFMIVRAMPNTAVAVGESMTCMAHNGLKEDALKEVESIFSCVGQTLQIEEELMQAATVVCASGIAFWMRFIRATTQGGVQLGFDARDAQKIAVQTCLGAASLLKLEDSHPEQEIDKVTTPQGCTIAGLNEMEHHGLSSALIKGLVTSFNRINQMKRTNETL